MTQKASQKLSRREFVKTGAVAAAATSAFPYFAHAQGAKKPIRFGLVGCGGRGRGASRNAMDVDDNVKLAAVADLFDDHIALCKKYMADKVDVEKVPMWKGFDAYKKVIASDVDYVILATPPYYRPDHLMACIEAGKNVFMEKPVAVDPVGIRKVMEAGKLAAKKGLSIVAGTQRRHQKTYIDMIKRIQAGEIGEITSGLCWWNSGQLWYKNREAGWSEEEWMHRDWVNWAWLSGDHIVEQHVHNIDVINWVLGTHPESVLSMGARHRRVTGDQFDSFSSDFKYPNEIHVHSQCRQINGCAKKVAEFVRGTKGWSDCRNNISTVDKAKAKKSPSPYIQEHADLIAAIRSGKPINEAQNVAESTMCAIMARTSAYTGKEVTWEEMMKTDLVLKRPDYPLTPENIKAHIPVPGEA